jgi:hypothetical protein
MFLVVLGLNLLVQSDAAYTRAMKIAERGPDLRP